MAGGGRHLLNWGLELPPCLKWRKDGAFSFKGKACKKLLKPGLCQVKPECWRLWAFIS